MAKILLVEDDRMNRELLLQLLEEYSVVAVSSAEEAFAALEQEQAQPALIIVDLGLPGLDGWELTRRLRADARWSETPIIAVTGHVRRDDTAAALAAGCTACIAKPLHEEELLAAVARYVGAGER